MKVTLKNYTPNPDDVIYEAACICYDRTANKEAVITHCIKSGHHSILEHASFNFKIEEVSRILLAQNTRHRMASFSVRSQRYCNEDGFDYVNPPTISGHPESYYLYVDTIKSIAKVYKELIEMGIPKEDARYILPGACHTKFYMTMNARSLYNFFQLRCCLKSQWEIRELANEMLELCKEVAPITFSMAGRYCDVYGECNQEDSCGRLDK